MAGGGTMDAAMAITAENAMVIAALNSMYPDTSNDGIIRRIEGKAGISNKNHGNQRLKERGFTDKKVTDIMENYSQKVYQEGGRTVYAKKNGNYYDVIITNIDGEIVTAVGGNTNSLKTWKDVTRMLNNNGGYSTLPY